MMFASTHKKTVREKNLLGKLDLALLVFIFLSRFITAFSHLILLFKN